MRVLRYMFNKWHDREAKRAGYRFLPGFSLLFIVMGFGLVVTCVRTISSIDKENPFDSKAAEPAYVAYVPPDPVKPPDGAALYVQYCATCHGEQGQGTPDRIPPLRANPRLQMEPSVSIRITLHGMEGPVKVGDRFYEDVMPPFGEQLSNLEIAALLTYSRNSWGNTASAVTRKEVENVRHWYSERRTPWWVDELVH